MAETLRQANRASAKTINPRRRASWHNGAALTGAPTLSRASWRQLAHYIPAPTRDGRSHERYSWRNAARGVSGASWRPTRCTTRTGVGWRCASCRRKLACVPATAESI